MYQWSIPFLIHMNNFQVLKAFRWSCTSSIPKYFQVQKLPIIFNLFHCFFRLRNQNLISSIYLIYHQIPSCKILAVFGCISYKSMIFSEVSKLDGKIVYIGKYEKSGKSINPRTNNKKGKIFPTQCMLWCYCE